MAFGRLYTALVASQLAAAAVAHDGSGLEQPVSRTRIAGRLELGYVSPFLLSNLDTTRQYAPLLQLHTRGLYRVSAYHIARSWTAVHPRLQQVINASVDHLGDLSRQKEAEIAAHLRRQRLHIALDNGGGLPLASVCLEGDELQDLSDGRALRGFKTRDLDPTGGSRGGEFPVPTRYAWLPPAPLPHLDEDDLPSLESGGLCHYFLMSSVSPLCMAAMRVSSESQALLAP